MAAVSACGRRQAGEDHKEGGGNVNKVRTAMRCCVHFTAILVVLLLLCLILSQKAYAYIDPGTGSYIFQMIIAFLVGGLFAVKLFWKKIKGYFNELFFKGKRQEKDES